MVYGGLCYIVTKSLLTGARHPISVLRIDQVNFDESEGQKVEL